MGDILKANYEHIYQEKMAFFKEKGAKAYIEKYGHYLPDGREVCDPTPMSIPVGCRKPMTLQEQLARLTPLTAYNLHRQWSEGDEEDSDLFDPEDPEDFILLDEIARKRAGNGSLSGKKETPATPVAGNSESVAHEPEIGEAPDSK